MFLKTLTIENFRNYDKLDLKLNRGINIIVGRNAQGKTNLLESIYVLALTRSHRSFIDNNLLKTGKEFVKINGDLIRDEIKTKFQVTMNNESKKLFIDNKPIKKATDYISNINVIIFYPEDLEIIKGSPQERRTYINLQLGQLNRGYLETLNSYNKLLKLRNSMLKKLNKNESIDQHYFDIVTEYIIDKAIIIYIMRNKYINKINQEIDNIFLQITKTPNLKIEYISGIENFDKLEMKQILKDKYKNNLNLDTRVGSTMFGPHKDDFLFILDNNDLKMYGSQGQQRAAILSLKLTEINIFKTQTGSNPILLLDDVFSELDDQKKNNLLRYINGEVQTIITTTDIRSINKKIIEHARIFKIKNGNVEKVK